MLQDQLKETNTDLFTKMQEVEDRNKELEAINPLLVDRLSEATKLKNECEQYETKIETIKSEIAKVNLQLAHQQKEKEEGEEELRELEKEFKEREEELERKEEDLDRKEKLLEKVTEELELKRSWAAEEKSKFEKRKILYFERGHLGPLRREACLGEKLA